MAKILLVDGSNFLFRAYNALPPLTTSKGEPTQAIKGMLNMLAKVCRTVNPDFGAVVFDAKGKNFRHEIYPEYKANRPPMDEDLRVQIEPVMSVIEKLGWPLLSVPGVEADDVLGTIAKRARRDGDEVVIATGDKDMMQLVEEGVSIFNSMSNVLYDAAAVELKYGVPPEKIVEYLALMGDKVDNIPGIQGCGPVTAAKWIKQFGGVDGLKAQADAVKGKTGEKLRAGLPMIDKSIELVTIKTDCSIPGVEKSSDLEFKPADLAALKAFGTRWEMSDKNIFSAVPAASRKTASAGDQPQDYESGRDEFPTDSRTLAPAELDDPVRSMVEGRLDSLESTDEAPYEVIDSALFMRDLEDFLNVEEPVAFSCITEEIEGRTAVCAAAFCVNPLSTRVVVIQDLDCEDAFMDVLRRWTASSSKKIFFNSKDVMHLLGAPIEGEVSDVSVMSYVLEAHEKHDLEHLARKFLGRALPSRKDAADAKKAAGTIVFDRSMQARIVAEEAAALKALSGVMTSRLMMDEKLRRVYLDIERPLTRVLYEAESNGILLDEFHLASMQEDMNARLEDIKAKIYEAAGREFNIASTKQLREILFVEMGIKPLKKTATGQPSTDEEVLSELALNYPLPKLILEYRSIAKLLSTYVVPLPRMTSPKDGRLHTTYSQTTAVTGRLSSSEPNLQNIPVRTAEGRRIREAFIAPEGSMIISADYSQVELRIMAHLSRDKGLLDAFERGLDVHKATAAEVFGCSIEDVSPEQRRTAKVINFGLIYGMSAFGLAKNLGITRTMASAYIDTYFAKYPGVKRYMNDAVNKAHDLGYVETLYGRRLWIPQIKMNNRAVKAEAERLAINAPVQGTAADVIKHAMVKTSEWLSRMGLRTKLLLQVHDELVLEAPLDEVELVRQQLPKIMSESADLLIPLVAEVGVGPNWEKAH